MPKKDEKFPKQQNRLSTALCLLLFDLHLFELWESVGLVIIVACGAYSCLTVRDSATRLRSMPFTHTAGVLKPNSILQIGFQIGLEKIAQLCSAQTLAHSPALRRREPQKYTCSYHGNKCLKGTARSVTKGDSRGPGKSQRDIKDT